MWGLITTITGGWISKAALIGATLVATAGGAWLWHTHQVDTARQQGRDEVTTRWHASEAVQRHLAGVAAQQTRDKEAQHAQALKRARAQGAADAAKSSAAVAAARSQFDSLQHTIAATDAGACADPADPSAIAGYDPDAAPATTGHLLGQCAAALVEMGEHAEGLANQARGLQAWADAVMQTQADPPTAAPPLTTP